MRGHRVNLRRPCVSRRPCARPAAALEGLEPRVLLSADPRALALTQELLAGLTTTGNDAPVYLPGDILDDRQVTTQTSQSTDVIRLDDFRADPRFAGLDGTGYASVIIDTGIDRNHPFFGPDSNGDGSLRNERPTGAVTVRGSSTGRSLCRF